MKEETATRPEEQTPEVAQALAVPSDLRSLIEALIFAAEEPLSVRQLKAIYEYSAPQGTGEERKIDADSIRAFIAELNAEYTRGGRPYRILQIAGGYQFATLKEYAEWLGKLRREQSRKKLSQSGIETLAIIAYKQPITKSEVESIRGVNCDYVLKTLLEKELVRVTGRAESVGRPLLYGTTREFLVHFGLNEITDLPRPREIEEILGETQFETERRMLEAQQAAEQLKDVEEEDFKSRLPHIPKRKPDLEESPVEIVGRERSKKLRTAPAPELPLEPPGPDVSSPEEEVPAVHPEPASAASASPAEPAPFEPTDVPLEPAVGSDPPESTVASTPRYEPAEGPTEADEAEAATSDRSRWVVWKEKIQGFIKRLFD